MALLELRSASKRFETAAGTRDVLRDIDFSIAEGEFVSIVGYSGSGKSTLVSLLAGLVPVTSGELRLGGEKLTSFAPDASIVFQNYSLLPWFSALENVRLAVEAAHPEWSRSKQRAQAEQYLTIVGLQGALQKRPSQLSGGMRQRVAIARAFSVEPRLLFLDEPFGALDALTRGTLQMELARLCSAAERKVTVVMVTNSVEEAILLSDRIIPLSKGPGATLGPAVAVDLPRPRSPETVAHDPAALAIEAHLIEYLKSIARGPLRRQTAFPQPTRESLTAVATDAVQS